MLETSTAQHKLNAVRKAVYTDKQAKELSIALFGRKRRNDLYCNYAVFVEL